jgi:hypothetical protein
MMPLPSQFPCAFPNSSASEVLSTPEAKRSRRHASGKLKAFAMCQIMVFIFAGAALAIENCPVGEKETETEGSYFDAVLAAVKKAPNCRRAYLLTQSCNFGDSKTNRLLEIVQAKCEPLFLPHASQKTIAAYRKAQARCNRIAEKTPGTMYQAFAAVCQAETASEFVRRLNR